MRKERQSVKVADLELNLGQVEWLPRNPRQWTKADIDKTTASIREDEDFLEDRPLLVIRHGDKFLVFGGNLRTEASRKCRLKAAPAVIYTPESHEDRETIKRRAMKDNGSFGSWDFDALANEWDTLPLTDWGIPVWEGERALTTAGGEKDEAYLEFEDKFKPKLTTDDCYTPAPVYDAVLAFVRDTWNLGNAKILRPFKPGGDYENEDYPEGAVVVDNPPFSIFAQILRFYSERNIPFFLFGPALTLFSATDCDITYIITSSIVTYENGAQVRTGFVTNLPCEDRVWICPQLKEAIDKAQEVEDKSLGSYRYPANVITAAILAKIPVQGVEFRVPKTSCKPISKICGEERDFDLFGGGLLISSRLAAERLAAERLAAKRAQTQETEEIQLSPKELAIIAKLDKQEAGL